MPNRMTVSDIDGTPVVKVKDAEGNLVSDAERDAAILRIVDAYGLRVGDTGSTEGWEVFAAGSPEA